MTSGCQVFEDITTTVRNVEDGNDARNHQTSYVRIQRQPQPSRFENPNASLGHGRMTSAAPGDNNVLDDNSETDVVSLL